MHIIGLDLSITATGIARHDGALEVVKYPKGVDGDRRLGYLSTSVKLAARHAQLAVLEGFVSGQSSVANLASGMVHGIVRLGLMGCTVPYVILEPSALKKFATGKGNATKADMRMAWYKRTGADVADDNAVDAAWLRQAGLHLVGDAEAMELPQAQLAALDKCRNHPVTVAALAQVHA